MPRPNPRYGEEDGFVLIDGYWRNLDLEKKLQSDYNNIRQLRETSGIHSSIPAGWDRIGTGINKGGGWRREGPVAGVNVTDQEAINYLELVIKIANTQLAQESYMCDYYPREANACKSAEVTLDTIRKVEKLLDRVKMQQRYPNVPEREILDNPDVYTVNSSSMLGSLIYENADTPWVSDTGTLLIDRKTGEKIVGQGITSVIPQVFAEEDPSINSGLNGNEQETQIINYPQSANVRISFTSNVGGFSTSIPINDVGQLQALDNASNEWRYTLIGSSTNQPLMSLSGLINKINSQVSIVVTPQPQPQPQPPVTQLPVITTDHVPAPEMPVEEPPITVTPTEPGQVNWIPEPFFSFINNVFRR